MRRKKIIKLLPIIVLIILITIPATYAIYKNIENGDGSISTAGWNVTIDQTNENDYLSIIPEPTGTTASYKVNIESNSEVSATYSIVLDKLPTGVSVALDDGQFVQENNNKVIFSNIGTILYNDTNKKRVHTITFKATSTATYINDKEIDLNVVAKQAL